MSSIISSASDCVPVTISPASNSTRTRSAAVRFSLGASSWIVMPRGTTISPSGTGASVGVSCGMLRRTEVLEVAAATLLAPRSLPLRTGPAATTGSRRRDHRPGRRRRAAGTTAGKAAHRRAHRRRGRRHRRADRRGRRRRHRGRCADCRRDHEPGVTGRARPGGGGMRTAPPGGGGIGRPERLRGGARRRRRARPRRCGSRARSSPRRVRPAGAGARPARPARVRCAGAGPAPVGDHAGGAHDAVGRRRGSTSGSATGSAHGRRAPPRPPGRARLGLGGSAAPLGSGSGSGSSTTGSRRRPLESARRRTRSADGSSMLDEWLFTPILSSLGEVEHDGVLDAELSRQLVDPDLLGRQALLSFAAVLQTVATVSHVTATRQLRGRKPRAQRPLERPAPHRLLEAPGGGGARTATRPAPVRRRPTPCRRAPGRSAPARADRPPDDSRRMFGRGRARSAAAVLPPVRRRPRRLRRRGRLAAAVSGLARLAFGLGRLLRRFARRIGSTASAPAHPWPRWPGRRRRRRRRRSVDADDGRVGRGVARPRRPRSSRPPRPAATRARRCRSSTHSPSAYSTPPPASSSCELRLALDVDAPTGEPGGEPRVLALLADGQRELEVGDDHLGCAGLGVDADLAHT